MCSVNPTPPSDSEFSWNCSTGCLADMEIEQTVSVTELEIVDSGVVQCSVIINDEEYLSEIIEVRVVSKLSMVADLLYVYTYITICLLVY